MHKNIYILLMLLINNVYRYPKDTRYYFFFLAPKEQRTVQQFNMRRREYIMYYGYMNRSCVDRLGVFEGSIIIVIFLQQQNKAILWIAGLGKI
jgi:hypothetical protein